MKALNIVTLVIAIIGGVNWGLVAIGGYSLDLVASLTGGPDSVGARVIYALVGLSALWQLVPLVRALQIGETHAEAGLRS